MYWESQMQAPSFKNKINPGKAPEKISVFSEPTELALKEWNNIGLQLPDVSIINSYRKEQVVTQLKKNRVDAILLFDPLNIRYATGTSNMLLWNTHNPFRSCLVFDDGHCILWDYQESTHYVESNYLYIDEVRTGASMFYFAKGDNVKSAAEDFSHQVSQSFEKKRKNNKKLAIDKIMLDGFKSLESRDFKIENGEKIMEHARSIKSAEEIKAMRCSISACETSIHVMENETKPGMTENDIWSILHSENIKRGGEWIETRLLSSGTKTNPWFQECGSRILQKNEIVAFDTDLVGCYSMCTDISRTWWIGDQEPTKEMKQDYQIALEHIQKNAELVAPGVHFKDLTFKGHQLDDMYKKQQYSCRFHGVGLCDEFPLITYPEDYEEGAFDYVLQPGMTLCVEALISRENGEFSIKLEDQLLVTDSGFENLTSYPFDEKFLN